MMVTSPMGLFKPQVIDTYSCIDGAGPANALLVLSRDEAEFLDAIHPRVSGLPSGAVACSLDHRHWEAQVLLGKEAVGASRTLQAAIAAVQAHCLAHHGCRFQRLATPAQFRVIESILSGSSLVARAQLKVIIAELALN